MREYLILLAQTHPNFRKAELEALSTLHNIKVDLSNHDESNPFMIVKLENDEDACKLVDRGILVRGIYELWGKGTSMDDLHNDVKLNMDKLKTPFMNTTFKFELYMYQGGKKSRDEHIELFEKFKYLDFKGKIRMKGAEQIYTILQKYSFENDISKRDPDFCWFGRQIHLSARSRGIVEKYEIANRPYYGTTTFDAELALLTCNMALVHSGNIVYDPFVGTGSFLVSAGEFGGITIGSDIDFRALKGKHKDKKLINNFQYYKNEKEFIDVLCMDFTNNALRKDLIIDSIICDPPYGIREGLKVCGASNEAKFEGKENVIIDGEKAFLRRDYIQPKKSYSLDLLLDDLLQFSAERLPINGRLCFWMPVANDEDIPTLIPHHENLELIHELIQNFNKWSRRLLVYVKRDENYQGTTVTKQDRSGTNNFRARYFSRFSSTNKSGM